MHHDVEEAACVTRLAQRLEQDADDHGAEHDARLAAGAAEDDHRVDRDQQRELEVLREDAPVQRGRERPRQGGDRGAERERHQLQPVDRHPHQLGGERILAQRAPGASRARVVQEAERHVHEREEDERDVEVAHGEQALRGRARQLPAEEAELVDVEDAVRPVRDALAEDVVAVVRRGEEHLEEEQRHDREVVAREPSRGQADEPPDEAADDGNERDHDERRQVDVVLLRAEERVGVGADAEEGDVSEVEQPTPPHDDVEPEREEHEHDRVERHAADVAALEAEREQADDPDEERQPGPPGNDGEPLLEGSEHSSAARAALAVTRDPLVLPDRRAGVPLGRARLGRALDRCREGVVPVARSGHGCA